MKIVNLGSLNIDHVYHVPHFARPGETLACSGYAKHSGGKGLNQSIALAKAGASVIHAGKIGRDGVWLRDKLVEYGVDASNLLIDSDPTGHAMIQIALDGQNSIVIEGGANQSFEDSEIEQFLATLEDGDYLLLQNETNAVESALRSTRGSDVTVVFNPAPITEHLDKFPLEHVDMFILNEVEGEGLTGRREPDEILDALLNSYPTTSAVLTLGERGVIYADSDKRLEESGRRVASVDTTAAGDTFVGFFLASLTSNLAIEEALRVGCAAAAICVTRSGAADSIPDKSELG